MAHTTKPAPVSAQQQVKKTSHATGPAQVPAHATTDSAQQLIAIAIYDKPFNLQHKIFFGTHTCVNGLHELCLTLSLDKGNTVEKLKSITKHNWIDLLNSNTYCNHTVIKVLPQEGAKWIPHFIKCTSPPSTAKSNHVNDFYDPGDLAETAAVLTAATFDDKLLKNFAGSQNQPPCAASSISGAKLIQWTKALPFPQEALPQLVIDALAKSTRMEHARMLKTLSEMPQALQQLPITIAIPTHLYNLFKSKAWAATTLFKYLCTAQGALRLLPMYKMGTASVTLSSDPNWQMAMKGARHLAVEHIPIQPTPATIDKIGIALKSAAGPFKEHVRAVIMLAWLTAARLGCIRQLKHEDLTFNEESRTINITFRRGKGVRCRQTHYTVTTHIKSTKWWDELVTFVQERKTFLFPKTLTDKHITKPLSTALLEQRSIRRGALQCMAADKVPPEILMNFSGHTSIKTLNRYLDFGKKRADLAADSINAAQSLWKGALMEEEWWDVTQGPPDSTPSSE